MHPKSCLLVTFAMIFSCGLALASELPAAKVLLPYAIKENPKTKTVKLGDCLVRDAFLGEAKDGVNRVIEVTIAYKDGKTPKRTNFQAFVGSFRVQEVENTKVHPPNQTKVLLRAASAIKSGRYEEIVLHLNRVPALPVKTQLELVGLELKQQVKIRETFWGSQYETELLLRCGDTGDHELR